MNTQLTPSPSQPQLVSKKPINLRSFQTSDVLSEGIDKYGNKVLDITKKTLFHGSNDSRKNEMKKADYDTIGSGVYFTSLEQIACGYAEHRVFLLKDGVATVYTIEVANSRFVDLDDSPSLTRIMSGFRDYMGSLLLELPSLLNELPKPKGIVAVTDSDIKRIQLNVQKRALIRAISEIDKNNYSPGSVRNVSFFVGNQFSDYLKSFGYDGLITEEGGEDIITGKGSINIPPHDTWLVFDPSKTTITRSSLVG